MTGRLRGGLGGVVDAAVLWRLGLIAIDDTVRAATLAAADPESFWAASTVAEPAGLDAVTTAGRRRERVDLVGPSRGPCAHEGGARVRARAVLAARGAPVAVLLHGYAAPKPWYEDHHARRLVRRGISAVRLDLPFHMGRRSPGRGHGDGFFSVEPARTCAVLRQAVEDAAAVVAWARRSGAPAVGVLGFSLGGLVASLLAARVPLDAVVAVTPPADLAHVILDSAPRRLRRRIGTLGGGGGPWGPDAATTRPLLEAALAPVTPARLQLSTSPERVTLVAAARDRIVGAEPVRLLASAWGAECWEYPHGHVTVMTARGLAVRIHDRLVQRLRAPSGVLAATA